jgi:hypothetical protein
VFQRKTQTESYWSEQFEITDQEVSRMYDLVLDAGKPVRASDLARALIEAACRHEEAMIQAELSRGVPYRPMGSYQIGEQITFPALDYAWATVVGARPAHSPEYGEFVAIQVQFEGGERIREFASQLRGGHKLDRGPEEGGLPAAGSVRSSDELCELYCGVVERKLTAELATHREFARFGDEWFLQEFLVRVSVGQLNIAEALIEVKGMPLTTADLLADLDLPAEVPDEIRTLSLKRALENDARFDNVGDSGRDVWYLRRLTPGAVLDPPTRLRLKAEPYSRQAIVKELLLVEREIDDEGVGEDVLGPARAIYRTNLTLTYPHWRSGTLPLTVRTQSLFPRPTMDHTPIVLVDGQSGDRFQGWVVREGAFVFGLADYYQRHSLPVGVFLKLERTRDPRVITVDYQSQRLKSVWAKAVTVRPGQLSFQMRKVAVACEFDEQMIIAEDSSAAIDTLREEAEIKGATLLQLMIRLVQELVRLSPQGTVHAKTIYSAVNVLRRTAPGPIFAILSVEPCFTAMGGGYWTFDAARISPAGL